MELDDLRDIASRDKAVYINEWDGNKHWWSYGKRHRLDGPAVISLFPGSAPYYEWWIEGVEYTLKEWCEKTGNEPDPDLAWLSLTWK